MKEKHQRGGNPVPVSEGTMATSKLCFSTTQQGGFHGVQPILLPLPGDQKHNGLLTAIDSPLNYSFSTSPVKAAGFILAYCNKDKT